MASSSPGGGKSGFLIDPWIVRASAAGQVGDGSSSHGTVYHSLPRLLRMSEQRQECATRSNSAFARSTASQVRRSGTRVSEQEESRGGAWPLNLDNYLAIYSRADAFWSTSLRSPAFASCMRSVIYTVANRSA